MEFPVEWDAVANGLVEVDDYQHMEYLICLNLEIDRHIQMEEEYNTYIAQSQLEHDLDELNDSVQKHEDNNDFEFFSFWENVPPFLRKVTLEIANYRIKIKSYPISRELLSEEAFNIYLVNIANILYGLYT